MAVWPKPAMAIEPVGLNFPVLGSYNSAESGPGPGVPPARRTRPSESRVAVWPMRRLVIEPVGLKPAGPGVSVGWPGVDAGWPAL